MTTAQKIDSLLKKYGLSRRQLAILAQIPPSSFQSAMERGGNMSVEMLQKVANVLVVPPEELLPLNVGGYIAKGLIRKGLSPQDLSHKTGIPLDKITSILASKHVPISKGERTALNLALGLDIDTYYLLGIESFDEDAGGSPSAAQQEELLQAFQQLNPTGQKEAVKRVQELGQITAYQKAPQD